jgi:hypothetical protein
MICKFYLSKHGCRKPRCKYLHESITIAASSSIIEEEESLQLDSTTTNNQQSTLLYSLPNEVVIIICSFLKFKPIIRLSQLNHHWSKLIRDSHFWELVPCRIPYNSHSSKFIAKYNIPKISCRLCGETLGIIHEFVQDLYIFETTKGAYPPELPIDFPQLTKFSFDQNIAEDVMINLIVNGDLERWDKITGKNEKLIAVTFPHPRFNQYCESNRDTLREMKVVMDSTMVDLVFQCSQLTNLQLDIIDELTFVPTSLPHLKHLILRGHLSAITRFFSVEYPSLTYLYCVLFLTESMDTNYEIVPFKKLIHFGLDTYMDYDLHSNAWTSLLGSVNSDLKSLTSFVRILDDEVAHFSNLSELMLQRLGLPSLVERNKRSLTKLRFRELQEISEELSQTKPQVLEVENFGAHLNDLQSILPGLTKLVIFSTVNMNNLSTMIAQSAPNLKYLNIVATIKPRKKISLLPKSLETIKLSISAKETDVWLIAVVCCALASEVKFTSKGYRQLSVAPFVNTKQSEDLSSKYIVNLKREILSTMNESSIFMRDRDRRALIQSYDHLFDTPESFHKYLPYFPSLSQLDQLIKQTVRLKTKN